VRRKSAQQLRLSGSTRATKSRLKEAVPKFEPGEPPRPPGLPRSQRRAWNALCSELLAARKLARTDAQLVLDLLRARAGAYKGAPDAREAARQELARLTAIFDGRTPFAAPAPISETDQPTTALTLPVFLDRVRQERATFAQRMQPDAAVCQEAPGTPYGWQ